MVRRDGAFFTRQFEAEKLMDLGQLISDAEPLIRQYGVLVVTIVS